MHLCSGMRVLRM